MSMAPQDHNHLPFQFTVFVNISIWKFKVWVTYCVTVHFDKQCRKRQPV